MDWIRPEINTQKAHRFAESLGVSPIMAALLQIRGCNEPEAARRFLSASLSDLSDPLSVVGMKQAVERVQQAVNHRQSVFIFGDYDVDGVTSTVLLCDFLRQFGLHAEYAVPYRLTEGYGLSINALERSMGEKRPDLFIAVDCGTSSSTEVDWLRRRGSEVIILDHHTSKEALPADCLLVNPHVHDPETAPYRNLCSVGLVFKFCHAFLKVLRANQNPTAHEIDIREYLDMVALGTVADLVPLHGENRILVKHGLKRLKECRRPGLCALMEASGIDLGHSISPFDIAFRLGPRINASGRLEDAELPIELLRNEDWGACRSMARRINEMNEQRQNIERAIAEKAEEMVQDGLAGEHGLVLYQPEWHAGVVGIVASRLARKFNRPAIVFGQDNEGALKGSGRSIQGIDLVEVLKAAATHLDQWGGHPMAVGLSIQPAVIKRFREDFNSALQQLFPEGVPNKSLRIDLPIRTRSLTTALLQDLDRMAPFGQGNPEPVFAIKVPALTGLSSMGKNHLRCRVALPHESAPVDLVAWNAADHPPPENTPLELAVRFGWNLWRGSRSPRLTLLDWQPLQAKQA